MTIGEQNTIKNHPSSRNSSAFDFVGHCGDRAAPVEISDSWVIAVIILGF